MLRPTNPSRERILGVGAWGAGKSNAWIRIAQWLRETGSPAKVYVLFTDFSMERALEGWDSSNVVAKEVGDYKEFITAGREFCKVGKRDDWLVTDLISDLWPWSEDHFSIMSFGESFTEWALTKSGGQIAGEHGSYWGKVNGLYREAHNKYVLRFPGHVYSCARVKEMRKDKQGHFIGEDDDKIVEWFGRYGVKPEGQKHLPYSYHTVVYFQEAGVGDYRINTVREKSVGDAARKNLVGVQLTDFVTVYLLGVAGWKL